MKSRIHFVCSNPGKVFLLTLISSILFRESVVNAADPAVTSDANLPAAVEDIIQRIESKITAINGGQFHISADMGAGAPQSMEFASRNGDWAWVTPRSSYLCQGGVVHELGTNFLEYNPSVFTSRIDSFDSAASALLTLNVAPRSLFKSWLKPGITVIGEVDVGGQKLIQIRVKSKAGTVDLYYDAAHTGFTRLKRGSGLEATVTKWDGLGTPSTWPQTIIATVKGNSPVGSASTAITSQITGLAAGDASVLEKVTNDAKNITLYTHPIEALPSELSEQRQAVADAPGNLSARVGLAELALRRGEISEALVQWAEIENKSSPAEFQRFTDWMAQVYFPPMEHVRLEGEANQIAWNGLYTRLKSVQTPFRGSAERAIFILSELHRLKTVSQETIAIEPELINVWSSSSNAGSARALRQLAIELPELKSAIVTAQDKWAKSELKSDFDMHSVSGQVAIAIEEYRWEDASRLLAGIVWGNSAPESSRKSVESILYLLETFPKVDAGDLNELSNISRKYSSWRHGALSNPCAEALSLQIGRKALRQMGSPEDIKRSIESTAGNLDSLEYWNRLVDAIINDPLSPDGNTGLKRETAGTRYSLLETVVSAVEQSFSPVDYRSRILLATFKSRVAIAQEPMAVARIALLQQAYNQATQEDTKIDILRNAATAFMKAHDFAKGVEFITSRTPDLTKQTSKEAANAIVAGLQKASAQYELAVKEEALAANKRRLSAEKSYLLQRKELYQKQQRDSALIASVDQMIQDIDRRSNSTESSKP